MQQNKQFPSTIKPFWVKPKNPPIQSLCFSNYHYRLNRPTWSQLRPFLFLHGRVEQGSLKQPCGLRRPDLPKARGGGCHKLHWFVTSQKIMRYFPARYLFKKTSVVRRKDGFQFGAGLRQGRLLIKTGSIKTGGSGSNQDDRVRVLSSSADSVQTILLCRTSDDLFCPS